MRLWRQLPLLALQLVLPADAAAELKIALIQEKLRSTYEVEAWQHFKIAIQDVNNGSTLPGFGPGGYTMKWILAPPGKNEAEALDTAERLLDEGVVGIVGPSHPVWMPWIAALCSLRETIIIAPQSDGIAEVNKAPYPYLFRTGPTQMQSLWALAVLCKEMYWHRVGVLSSDEMSGSSTARVLVPALDALKILSYVAVFIATSGSARTQATAGTALDSMTGIGYRVVIFNALKKDTYDVVVPFRQKSAILEACLMTTDFLQGSWWLRYYPNAIEVYNQDMVSRYSDDFPNPVLDWHRKRWKTDTTCFDPTNENHTKFDPVTGDPFYGSGDEIWDADSDDFNKTCNKWPEPRAWFIYDSVMALARAMSKVIQAGSRPTNGSAVREAMLDVDFVGVTNRVFFDRTTQDRTAPVPLFTTGMHVGSASNWSMFLAKTTDAFASGGAPGDFGWCSSGCLSRNASELAYPKIPWTWKETPRDGRQWQSSRAESPTQTEFGRPNSFTEGKLVEQGISARDAFGDTICRRECGGDVPVPTAECTRCIAVFADFQNYNITAQEEVSGRVVKPVVPWVWGERPESGRLASPKFDAPQGFEGAGPEDRTLKMTASYLGRVVTTWTLLLTTAVCREGYFSSSDVSDYAFVDMSCVKCIPGTISTTRGAPNCTRCPTGMMQPFPGQATCTSCSAGKHTPHEGTTDCATCPLGRYQPEEGQSDCRPCPRPMVTVKIGNVNVTSCICPVDTYRPASARLDASMTDFPCVPCPVGMKCEQGSDERAFGTQQLARRLSSSAAVLPETVSVPRLLPSYWSAPDEPMDVFLCLSGERQCPGGAPGKCGSHLSGMVCGSCAAGYYRDRGACYACPSKDLSRLLFPVMPVFASIFFVLLLYYTSRDKDGSVSWNLEARATGHTLAISLAYFQTAGLVLKTNIKLPGNSESSTIWSLLNKPMGLLQLECAGVQTFQGRMAVNMFLPIYAALSFLFILLLSMFASRFRPGARMDSKVVGSCFGSALIAFYISICALSMDLFKCYEHSNGLTSVSSAPQIICGSREWKFMMAFAIFCTVVYCGGSAAIFIWVLAVAPGRAKNEDFKALWKFLLARFRTMGRWWAMAWIAKGFLLNLVQVVFLQGQDQLVALQLILGAYAAITLWAKPWRHPMVNIVDAAVHTILCLACAPLYWFAPVPQDRVYTVRAILVEKVLLIVPPIMLALFMFAKKAHAFYLTKKQGGHRRATVKEDDICEYHGVLADFCALESEIAGDIVLNLAPMDRQRMVMVCAALNNVFPDVVSTSTTQESEHPAAGGQAENSSKIAEQNVASGKIAEQNVVSF